MSMLKEGPLRDNARLKLALVCPQCGAEGWTGLDGLKRGMRCPQCRCQFMVDSTGRLLTANQFHQVRYTCPRCRQTGTIPARLKVRKAVCSGCQLALVAGPDEQLYGEKEAKELRRAASAAAGRIRLRERLAARLTTADGRWRWWNISLLAALMMASLAGSALVLARLFDQSAEARAGSLTYACLAGQWDDARDLLPDNAAQRAEFDRFRVRHFGSIRDKFRPAGDRVVVDAVVIGDEPTRCVIRLTMKSPFLGTRTHVQHWLRQDDMWFFDPVATLAASDGIRPRPAQPPR
jgi:hypothetical protein